MGFKEEKVVQYDKIFTPVVKMTTLHLLLRVIAIQDLELEQMDVKISITIFTSLN